MNLFLQATISSSRYFYDELHQLAYGSSPLRNIFLDPHTGKLQLRNNVSIHLVLSDAPNGDAKEFLPSDTNNYLNAYDAVDDFSIRFVSIRVIKSKGSNENGRTCTGF